MEEGWAICVTRKELWAKWHPSWKPKNNCQQTKRKQLYFYPALKQKKKKKSWIAEFLPQPNAHQFPAAEVLALKWLWLFPHGCRTSGAGELKREVGDHRSRVTPCPHSSGFLQPPLFAPEMEVVAVGWHRKLWLTVLGQNQSQKLGSLWGTEMSVHCFLCSKINVWALCIHLSRGFSHLPLQKAKRIQRLSKKAIKEVKVFLCCKNFWSVFAVKCPASSKGKTRSPPQILAVLQNHSAGLSWNKSLMVSRARLNHKHSLRAKDAINLCLQLCCTPGSRCSWCISWQEPRHSTWTNPQRAHLLQQGRKRSMWQHTGNYHLFGWQTLAKAINPKYASMLWKLYTGQ